MTKQAFTWHLYMKGVSAPFSWGYGNWKWTEHLSPGDFKHEGKQTQALALCQMVIKMKKTEFLN